MTNMSCDTFNDICEAQITTITREIKYKIHEESTSIAQNDKSIDQNCTTELPLSCMKTEIILKTSDTSDKILPDENKNGFHSTRRVRRPWITEEFMQMIEQRDKLHSRMKKSSGNATLKKEFSFCRNQAAALRRKLKLAYQKYLEEL